MKHHLQDRKAQTPKQIDRIPPPPLSPTKPQTRVLRIHDSRQRSQNASDRSRHADVRGDHDLDLDVAEAVPAEPAGGVVVAPEQGVDEVLQVQDQEPEDQAGGADVAVGGVPEHWGEDEEGYQEGEGGEEDGRGVGLG